MLIQNPESVIQSSILKNRDYFSITTIHSIHLPGLSLPMKSRTEKLAQKLIEIIQTKRLRVQQENIMLEEIYRQMSGYLVCWTSEQTLQFVIKHLKREMTGKSFLRQSWAQMIYLDLLSRWKRQKVILKKYILAQKISLTTALQLQKALPRN